MKKPKEKYQVKSMLPAGIIRQRSEFSNVSGFGRLSGEYFSLSAGMDTRQIQQILDVDLCQSPHWGYVVRGHLTTIDSSGRHYSYNATELFYWPPGHFVRVDADAEIVMFSPQHEHAHGINQIIDHPKPEVSEIRL